MSAPVERKPQPNSAFETSRSSRRKPSQLRHPAIKHGGYSGMSLLPGEDPAEFKKLHEELVTEYAPTGPHEHEIVETMARLMWRKRCLWNYGLAEFARQRYSAIKFEPERIKFEPQMNRTAKSTDELPEEERQQQAVSGDELIELFVKLRRSPQYQRLIEQEKLKEEHIRRELGAVDLELAKIRHVATTGYLMHELSIIDRIDGMIDRCLKRLLLVRGLKSISSSVSAAPNRLTASVSAASEEKC